jgi:hypothetical protein
LRRSRLAVRGWLFAIPFMLNQYNPLFCAFLTLTERFAFPRIPLFFLKT